MLTGTSALQRTRLVVLMTNHKITTRPCKAINFSHYTALKYIIMENFGKFITILLVKKDYLR